RRLPADSSTQAVLRRLISPGYAGLLSRRSLLQFGFQAKSCAIVGFITSCWVMLPDSHFSGPLSPGSQLSLFSAGLFSNFTWQSISRSGRGFAAWSSHEKSEENQAQLNGNRCWLKPAAPQLRRGRRGLGRQIIC